MTTKGTEKRDAIKLALRKTRGSYCERCNKALFKIEVVLHHRNRDRGDNYSHNLNILCDSCHREIHSCNEKEWLEKKPKWVL